MNKKGVGLGLAISKKIVKEFGGEIGVKSQLKEGSTFFFNVKLENEDAFMADNIFIEFDETYSEQFIDKSFIDGQGGQG
jgi:signal transduction histidine kinase